VGVSGIGISARTAQIVSDALMRARRQYRADPCIYSELLAVESAVLANGNSNSCDSAIGIGTVMPMRDNADMGVTEAASQCGVSPQALRHAIKSGRIKAVKSGGIWVIDAREVIRFRAARREREG
jgi:hypothetical protein